MISCSADADASYANPDLIWIHVMMILMLINVSELCPCVVISDFNYVACQSTYVACWQKYVPYNIIMLHFDLIYLAHRGRSMPLFVQYILNYACTCICNSEEDFYSRYWY